MKASCKSSDGSRRDSFTLLSRSWKSSFSARENQFSGQILVIQEPERAGHPGRGAKLCGMVLDLSVFRSVRDLKTPCLPWTHTQSEWSPVLACSLSQKQSALPLSFLMDVCPYKRQARELSSVSVTQKESKETQPGKAEMLMRARYNCSAFGLTKTKRVCSRMTTSDPGADPDPSLSRVLSLELISKTRV